ncbi:MAG TPA: DUF1949 domain-containing protein, partial [Pseudoxanthomonas sp.]|nr:DUF1949 domain-containing protein [Pseudoxanthomonas sp.]
GAAAECLRQAARRALVPMCEMSLRCPFGDLGSLHAALATYQADSLSEDFDESGVILRLRLPADRVPALKKQLRDATRNRVRFAESDP